MELINLRLYGLVSKAEWKRKGGTKDRSLTVCCSVPTCNDGAMDGGCIVVCLIYAKVFS